MQPDRAISAVARRLRCCDTSSPRRRIASTASAIAGMPDGPKPAELTTTAPDPRRSFVIDSMSAAIITDLVRLWVQTVRMRNGSPIS
jgi:hypothetical protein